MKWGIYWISTGTSRFQSPWNYSWITGWFLARRVRHLQLAKAAKVTPRSQPWRQHSVPFRFRDFPWLGSNQHNTSSWAIPQRKRSRKVNTITWSSLLKKTLSWPHLLTEKFSAPIFIIWGIEKLALATFVVECIDYHHVHFKKYYKICKGY